MDKYSKYVGDNHLIFFFHVHTSEVALQRLFVLQCFFIFAPVWGSIILGITLIDA